MLELGGNWWTLVCKEPFFGSKGGDGVSRLATMWSMMVRLVDVQGMCRERPSFSELVLKFHHGTLPHDMDLNRPFPKFLKDLSSSAKIQNGNWLASATDHSFLGYSKSSAILFTPRIPTAWLIVIACVPFLTALTSRIKLTRFCVIVVFPVVFPHRASVDSFRFLWCYGCCAFACV